MRRSLVWIAFAGLLLESHAFAQSRADAGPETAEVPVSGNDTTEASTVPTPAGPEFVPMTISERARLYLKGAFGPSAVLRSLAGGGIAQLTNTPKEWGGGAAAYGDRVGNAFATHVIREALEFGGSTALHEDNRYIRSTDKAFVQRAKHAALSVFVAHNDAGQEHFAYSRLGSVLGSAFISRVWQPRSTDSAGDAAVNFGVTIISDMGWNLFKEFRPSLGKHFRKN